MRTIAGRLKQRLRLDVGREICRQYPLFCFLLLCLSAASLLLNRYLPLAPRRPLGSPRAVLGCRLLTAGESQLRTVASGGAAEVAPGYAGWPTARGPGILRGYLALNLSFLTISQNLGLCRLFFSQPKYV